MSFYTSISAYYDMLFPYDHDQTVFFERVLNQPETEFFRNVNLLPSVSRRGFLDIGCATGTIISEFTDRFDRLAGIDLDEGLLKQAAEKLFPGQKSKVELLQDDMMDLPVLFPEEQFSLITCLGNTLPHLTKTGQIHGFFTAVQNLLETNGLFIFQILFYDRIIDNNIQNLPIIRKENVTFIRQYSIVKNNGLIDFNTELTDSLAGITINNSIELLPVRKKEIESLLHDAGFSLCEFFGDYKANKLDANSFLLIAICRK